MMMIDVKKPIIIPLTKIYISDVLTYELLEEIMYYAAGYLSGLIGIVVGINMARRIKTWWVDDSQIYY